MSTKRITANNNANTKTNKVAQPFCKVCQDAGKPESEFRSHFTRLTADRNSKVTCPLLLSLECQRCFKLGHTQKYCTVTLRNPKQANENKVAEPKKSQPKQINAFACLDTDDESDDEMLMNEPEEDFWLPTHPMRLERQTAFSSYAAALQSEVQVKVAEPQAQITRPLQTRSWVEMDAESSDGEDIESVLPRPVLIRNNRL
jgi:hypothetical protein